MGRRGRDADREMAFFDGLADDFIPKEKETEILGWSKESWLSDPQVPGAPLDPEHIDRPIGHIVHPYVGRDTENPNIEMPAIRGALYMDDPVAQHFYQRIQAGDPTVGLSIQYNSIVDANTGTIVGKTGLRVGVTNRAKNKRCKITVRQNQTDPSQVTLNIPLRSMVATKADAPFTLCFPKTAPSTATPTPAMATPAPPANGGAAAPPANGAANPAPGSPAAAAAAPPAPPAQAPPTDMDTDDPAKLAQALQSMSPEELRKRALDAAVMSKRMASMEAEMAKRDEAEKQRLQAERDSQFKTQVEKYKDLLPDLGIVDGEKADGQRNETFKYLLQDPNAQKSKATDILVTAMDVTAKTRNENAELKKKNEELTILVETMKKIRPEPQFGSKSQQPAQQPAYNPLRDPAVSAELEKGSRAARASGNDVHPLTGAGLAFPVFRPDSRQMTFINTQPAPGRNIMVPVAQNAVSGTAATGDKPAVPASGNNMPTTCEDPALQRLSEAFSTGNTKEIRLGDGATIPFGSFVLRDPKSARPVNTDISESDMRWLQNRTLNRGLGATLKTGNALDADPDAFLMSNKNAKRATSAV